jgi:hypothetical protein
MRVIRVVNPSAMDLAPILRMFERAAEALPGIHPPASDLSDWMRKRLDDEDIMFLVAYEPGIEPRGYVLIHLATDIWNRAPWVASFHADGPAARRALIDGMHLEMTALGVTKIHAINQTGASDRAYAWLWRPKAKVRVIGPAVEFSFELLTDPAGGGKEEA